MQKLLWMRSEGSCEKEILFQADHTFSSRQAQEEAIRCTVNWLNGLAVRREEWHHWSI
jgi:hypothetical protein